MVYNVFPTCLLFVVVVVAVFVLDLLHTRDVEHFKERSSTVIFPASTRFSIFHRKIILGGGGVLLSPCIARLIIFCTGSIFETHTAELAPSVRELAEMEFKAQTSFLSLQHRDWMRH